LEINFQKKIRNGHIFTPGNGRQYVGNARQIVDESTPWVAVRTNKDLQAFTLGEHSGVRIKDGPVLQLRNCSWNEMLQLAKFSSDLKTEWDTQLFETPFVSDVKIGVFEDVYRTGYILFPVEFTLDLSGKPLMLTKGKRKNE